MIVWDKADVLIDRRTVYQMCLGALTGAQKLRKSAPSADAWITYERGTMLTTVNTERAKRNKPSVDLTMLMRAEANAVGHIDYSTKFARYCADLVFTD